MAKMALVHCRMCGKPIDRLSDSEQPWFMPAKNQFFHIKCYNEFEESKKIIRFTTADPDDDWRRRLTDYLSKDLKQSINYVKLGSQWKNFIAQGMKPKGIFFAVRYFYEYLKGDKNKAQGGIGIVPSIYAESCEYWTQRDKKEREIIQEIEEQLAALEKQENSDSKIIFRPTKEKQKNFLSFSEALSEEEDVE